MEKACCQTEVPVDFDRPLTRKGTHNPNYLPHRDDNTGKEDIGDLYDKPIDRSLWSIDTSEPPSPLVDYLLTSIQGFQAISEPRQKAL
jgi:hypothetical protein